MANTNSKLTARKKRAKRNRTKVSGTSERPRLCVFRSNRHIYVQIIDESTHSTLVSMSSQDKEFQPADKKKKCEVAKEIGAIVAKRAKDAGVTQVVFDRGGNLYHGRVKSLSEGARKGGLVF